MIIFAVSLTLNLTPVASVTLGSVVVSAKISLMDSAGLAASVMTTFCIFAAVTAVWMLARFLRMLAAVSLTSTD